MAVITDILSSEGFQECASKNKKLIVFFWASWSEPCAALNDVVTEVANAHSSIHFAKVEAEAVPEVSGHLEITAVPTFVLLKSGKVCGRIEGYRPAELFSKAEALASEEEQDLKSRLKQLTTQEPVMLFMKGTPDTPRCGFSRKVVEALRHAGVPFGSFDILTNDEVRQGLKEFSDWPTYPQLYAGGELLGGCDIILEMARDNELKGAVLDAVKTGGMQMADGGQGGIEVRIRSLLASQPVMLFMKGSPEQPRCGFSRRVVDALNSDGISFGHFDILSDEDVRQGLKKYSDWPTYPQLYAKGELIGGCDIIEELHKTGELKSTIEQELAN